MTSCWPRRRPASSAAESRSRLACRVSRRGSGCSTTASRNCGACATWRSRAAVLSPPRRYFATTSTTSLSRPAPRWRTDGVGRASLHPLPIDDGLEVLTPDDLLRGRLPAGERIVLYDDDHYYMGGVLAELLADAGKHVTLVTPEPLVSAWTVNTMEQPRIHARLVAAGVTIILSHAQRRRPRRHPASPASTPRETTVPADALVLVTARLPNDELATELARAGGARPSRRSATRSPRARSPNAVWDGHRYAEELDDPAAQDRDQVPFRREIIALARPTARATTGLGT